ncbi:hypothetical protein V5O48_008504 [Marasmius crinis-equi]|uniref:BHLH domain-containing protein n=1 Tax=Marasmius crinis-equi TaxID=585013 RepID=A0ABR3FDP7_9AGAR
MSSPVFIPSPPTASGYSNVSPSPDLPHPHSEIASRRNASGGNGTPTKRKPNKRLNTAEHRAVHNAVERARRETLNGRFLDLAKQLPNLSQIRRPSKSAIVNSSIAHLIASRRHRTTASRELRILKLEADHLRKELNEWRDRAGITRVEEPARGEGFSMVLNQELEDIPVLKSGLYDDEELGDDASSEGDSYPGSYMDEHQAVAYRSSPPALSINTNVTSAYLRQPHNPRPAFPHRSSSTHQTMAQPMIATPHYEDHHLSSEGFYDVQSFYANGFVHHQQEGKYANSISFDRQLQGVQMSGRGLNGGYHPMMVQ